MSLHLEDPAARLETRLAVLEHENARLKKVKDVLTRRVERGMDVSGSAFSLFEHAVLLEGKARERTVLLEGALAASSGDHRVLAGAKAEAEADHLAKTRFLASALQDLLQPLNAARLFIAALAEIELPVRATRLVESIDIACEAIERPLKALLDLSELDAGMLAPASEDVPLHPLFRQLVAELAPVAERKGLLLRAVATSAVVRTDRDLLARLLLNLVANAVCCIRRGGVLLGVRRDGAGWRVEVVETGVGIPATERMATVKERRWLKRDADQAGRGFGLELAVVDRIARILDHPLAVRSVAGRGSGFALRLPASPPKEAVATRDRLGHGAHGSEDSSS